MLRLYQKGRRGAEASGWGCLSRRMAGVALASLASLSPSVASAEVLLFSANTGEQTFTGTNASLADLNGSATGGTSLSFATSQANQRVSIVFDATCFLSGTDETWAVVTILVDPAGSALEFKAPPTNSTVNGGVLCCHENSEGVFLTA